MAGNHGHHAETIENENSVRNPKTSDTFQAVRCFEGKLNLKLYVTCLLYTSIPLFCNIYKVNHPATLSLQQMCIRDRFLFEYELIL